MKLSRAEAYDLFLEGKAHPRCPACGHTRLRHLSMTQEAGVVWRMYRCIRCPEVFRATVEPGSVDIKV